MNKKINAKIQKKIDNISQLKSALGKWKSLSEDDVLKLIKEFEKTPRAEGSSFYNDYFNDSKFAETLLSIGNEYSSNSKLTVFIISSLGNMMERYGLKETQGIFEYFLSNSNKKGVSVYVSLFFTQLENFANYSDKWDYIMSVKDMKPSKIADSSFETIVKSKKDEIPKEYKQAISDHFVEKAESANSDSGKNYFLSLAKEF